MNMIGMGLFVLFLLFQVKCYGCILNANTEKITLDKTPNQYKFITIFV